MRYSNRKTIKFRLNFNPRKIVLNLHSLDTLIGFSQSVTWDFLFYIVVCTFCSLQSWETLAWLAFWWISFQIVFSQGIYSLGTLSRAEVYTGQVAREKCPPLLKSWGVHRGGGKGNISPQELSCTQGRRQGKHPTSRAGVYTGEEARETSHLKSWGVHMGGGKGNIPPQELRCTVHMGGGKGNIPPQELRWTQGRRQGKHPTSGAEMYTWEEARETSHLKSWGVHRAGGKGNIPPPIQTFWFLEKGNILDIFINGGGGHFRNTSLIMSKNPCEDLISVSKSWSTIILLKFWRFKIYFW